MMDCKKALAETNGDMEAAVDWLRTRGLAKAAKKAGRIAAEGLVGIAIEGTKGADRRGQLRDRFRRPQRAVPGDRRQCRQARARRRAATSTSWPKCRSRLGPLGCGRADRRHRQDRREHEPAPLAVIEVKDGVIGTYVHNAVKPGHGQARHPRRPRVDRRQGRAGRASASSSRCTSPTPTRCRSRPTTSTRRSSPRSARSSPSRPRNPASRPRSSPRWSRAACASSTRKSRFSRRPSSSTARARSATSSRRPRRTPARRSR